LLLQREVTSDDFRVHFEQYGTIEDAAIVADGAGVSRGFGFVTFDNAACVEKALIVKHVFGDRTVDCKRAVPREELRGDRPVRHSPVHACLYPHCLVVTRARRR
jgi:RNA recognition motif-containing protein